MTLNEINKYVRKLEQAGHFSDHLKYALMKKIKEEYDYQKTIFGQSRESKLMADEIEELPLPDPLLRPGDYLSQVHGTWNKMMFYLNDKNNNGKTLQTTIKKEIQRKILDDHPAIRYKTGHVNNSGMHRLTIFANKTVDVYTNHSHAWHRDVPWPIMIFFAGVEVGTFAACLPFFLARGIFHAVTRNPLSIDKQKALFEKLERVTDIRDKRAIIIAVAETYRTNERISNAECEYDPRSKSSKALHSYLSGTNINTEDEFIRNEWSALLSYMRARDGDYLKNNGKLLFNCIHDTVNRYELPLDAPRMRRLG